MNIHIRVHTCKNSDLLNTVLSGTGWTTQTLHSPLVNFTDQTTQILSAPYSYCCCGSKPFQRKFMRPNGAIHNWNSTKGVLLFGSRDTTMLLALN